MKASKSRNSLIQRSTSDNSGVYNPRTRIRIRTVIGGWILLGLLWAQPGNISSPADRVVVLKKERTLQLWRHGKVLRSFKIALGGDPIGAKTRQGDHKTPEGVYVLDSRNAHSQFYKAIHISYPNTRDREAARRNHVSPGGDVFVHGLPNGYKWVGSGHRLRDWTDGCIAVTDEEMDEIWQSVADGTPIEIHP